MAYFEHLFILICIYTILAQSLNLVMGYTGLFNLGHIAFYGIGAYTAALLALAGYPVWVTMVMAGVMAGLAGLVIGIPVLRLKGHYLAIATFGFAEIVRSIMLNWTSLTRGPMGLPGIPRPVVTGIEINNIHEYVVFALLVAVLCGVVLYFITHSHFSRVLKAIREDEMAVQALGKNVVKYKIQALMTGAFFAGIAGSLYVYYINFIDPSSFVLQEMVLLLLMVVIGGAGSFYGSILGAIVLVILPEPLRFLNLPAEIVAPMRQLIYAVILILMMLYKPAGFIHPEKFQFRIFRKK